MDGGLRCAQATRPTLTAYYPIPVRRVVVFATRFLQTPPRDDALALR